MTVEVFLAQGAEVAKEVTGRLVPVLRGLGEHLVDDSGQPGRQVGTEVLEVLGLFLEVLHGHGQGRLAFKGRRAGEHVIAGHAERIDVTPRIERLSFGLLRAHVQGRPHGNAHLGEIDDLHEQGREFYLSMDFDSAYDAMGAALAELQDLDGEVMKLKDRSLVWIYLVEWLVTTGVLLISGVVIWSLMVRRTLYREVKVTRLR